MGEQRNPARKCRVSAVFEGFCGGSQGREYAPRKEKDNKKIAGTRFPRWPVGPAPGVHINGVGWDGTSFGTPKIEMADMIPDISSNPFTAFALGGIAMQTTHALIGEAGYPEAVIPLNQRGADVLAATMARYVGNSDVRGSRVESYATPTANYYSTTSDYSTQFNGQITVQSQNPDQLAQQLRARACRQRLAQPVGGGSR